MSTPISRLRSLPALKPWFWIAGLLAAGIALVAGTAIFGAIAYGCIVLSMLVLSQLPVYFGVGWSAFMLLFSLVGIWQLQELPVSTLSNVKRMLLIGVAVVQALAFAGAMALLAFTLAHFSRAEYMGGGALTAQRLYDHFLWQFVDLIPGLNVWDTLKVADPAHEAGMLAGALLIAYKAAVIAVVFYVLKQLLTSMNDDSDAAATNIAPKQQSDQAGEA